MYAIRESKVKVNDEMVTTFCRPVLEGDTSILAEAGTTGYRGGNDRKTGARTYVSLFFGGDFLLSPVQDRHGRIAGVEISLCGDDALDAMIKALTFARKALDDRRCGMED